MLNNEIFTVKETAEILKISISELRKLMSLKQITFFEIGEITSKRRTKRFRKSDIESYITNNLVSYVGEE